MSRLALYVYPVLKDTPIDRVTLDDCQRVMEGLPKWMKPATRRNVGQLMTRLLSIAVYPLRLIERSPLPPKFLPRAPGAKAKGYLYPSDDRRLLAFTAVPLVYRLLWGFLDREGCAPTRRSA